MDDIRSLIRAVNLELSPVFEEKLRQLLADKDRDWLVDQVVRLSLDAHGLREIDRRSEREAKARARAARLERVRALRLDASGVAEFVATHRPTTRDSLIASGHLLADAPAKGTELLTSASRSAAGEELLEYAKDVLFALLFGDASTLTSLDRVQQELLTFALPVAKAGALDFMRASTEITAAGTWQDPESVSNDERAANTLLEVQYGDTADELVGHGVIAALGLINNLEVNEQVLYARMIDVEQTTLIS
ncbi:hypothetical protein [Pseudolysinimonas yzui]|uniref:Uncharacterized protein n=1 Tax=Pseudolysinimonas yzui TaxID=2708254 RepID=A0A8J3GSF0_9MICO|nr:hypothetical protein [Pseudolysinimonas yzui]GHF25611.1 hypothetical protein GCM10011600_28260 [Pseudolysinimonas yzui]